MAIEISWECPRCFCEACGKIAGIIKEQKFCTKCGAATISIKKIIIFCPQDSNHTEAFANEIKSAPSKHTFCAICGKMLEKIPN